MTLTGLRLKKNGLTIFIVVSGCQGKFTILIQGKLDRMTPKKNIIHFMDKNFTFLVYHVHFI